jgi:hypothetical protein
VCQHPVDSVPAAAPSSTFIRLTAASTACRVYAT